MDKLKVVLVTLKNTTFPDMGLRIYQIAASLKTKLVNELDVQLIAASMIASSTSGLNDTSFLVAKILATKARYVGLSIPSYASFEPMLQVAREVKRLDPAITLFAGGHGVCNIPDLVFENDLFEFVIVGEGESATVKAFECIIQNKTPEGDGIVVANSSWSVAPFEDLATLPSPWLMGLIPAAEKDFLVLEVARGCPFGCDYCYMSTQGRRVRVKPLDLLEQEFDYIFTHYKSKSIAFNESSFGVDVERTKKILSMLIEKDPNRRYSFQVYPDSLSDEVISYFAKLTNCELNIGLQTADEEILRSIGRNNFSEERYAHVIEQLLKHKISFYISTILGLPGQTTKTVTNTIEFLKRIGATGHVNTYLLFVLPGTKLFESAEQLGLVYWPRDTKNAGNGVVGPYLIRSTRTMSSNEIYSAFHRMNMELSIKKKWL